MSEEINQAKAKLIPGECTIEKCPFCNIPFEEPLPENIYNQCSVEEGCGKIFRVVTKK